MGSRNHRFGSVPELLRDNSGNAGTFLPNVLSGAVVVVWRVNFNLLWLLNFDGVERSFSVDDANVDFSVDLVGGGGGHSDVALLIAAAGLLDLQHQWSENEVGLDGRVFGHWADFNITDAFQRRKSIEGRLGLLVVVVGLLLLAAWLLLGAALALRLLVVDGVGGDRALLLLRLGFLDSLDYDRHLIV